MDYETIITHDPRANTLILAGDIGSLRPDTLTPFLDYCCSNWPNVIYVAGNHEFYDKKKSVTSIIKMLRAKAHDLPNLHFLDRDIAIVDGQRFLGCTLWSMPKTRHGLNDFKWISHSISNTVRCPIGTDTMTKWHQTDLAWLQQNVQEGDIIVTHFMPFTTHDLIQFGHKSIYPVSELDFYYGNTDCWDLFKRKPKLWISGHTHQAFNVSVDNVSWISNPYGYPGEYTGHSYQSGIFELSA